MIKLAGNENMVLATATLMCVHAGRSKETRDEFLTEWERNAVQYLNVFNRKKHKVTNKIYYKGQRRIGRVYSLSGVFLDDGSSQYYVCKNAFREVFDIGMYYHERIKKTVKDGNLVPSLHKLCGKDGNALLDSRVSDSLIAYLEVKKTEAEPHASKVVRTTTKMELREDDDKIELPSNYTKRGMYVDWCYNQGFKAKLVDVTGSYGKLVDYARRDDMELTEDHEVRQHICTYASFKKIWETNFNDLIIKKSSHDTCGTCFRFSNLLNGL